MYALSVCRCWFTYGVTDPTGPVVPSANVEATKAETEAVYSDPRGKLCDPEFASRRLFIKCKSSGVQGLYSD